jgi:cytochrome c55X
MPSRIVVLLLALCTAATGAAADSVSAARRDELLSLVHQDCGSCHGMRLSGGLGPALTPEALQDKNREFLAITIREGRPGTPMPPWKTLLSEADIEWIVEYLKNQGVTP